MVLRGDDTHAPAEGAATLPAQDAPGGAARLRVHPTLLVSAVVLGAIAVGVARAADRLEGVVGLVLSAATLALLTAPLQRRLANRIGEAGSLVSMALVTFVVTVAAQLIVIRELGASADAIALAIAEQMDGLRPGSLVDRLADASGLAEGIDGWLGDLPSLVVTGELGSAGVGRSIVELLFVVVLATFLQSSRATIVNAIVERWPRDPVQEDPPDESPSGTQATTRRDVRNVLQFAEQRGVGYVRRSALLGIAAGAVAGSMWWIAGLPGALVVAVWCAMWSVVPTMGWAIAALPAAVFAAFSPRPATILAAVGISVLAIGVGWVRRRFVDRATVALGAAVQVIAIATGAALGGLQGTIVGLTVGALATALATAPQRLTWPRRTPTEEAGIELLPSGRSTWVLAWRAALWLLGTVAAVALVLRTLEHAVAALAWVLVGSFVAIALSRPAAFFGRLGLRPNAARAMVLALAGLAIGASLVAGADDGVRTTTTLAEQAPQVVAAMEDLPLVGGWIRDNGTSNWVAAQLEDVPQNVGVMRPADWLPGVSVWVVHLLWTVVIAIALLFDGRRLVDAFIRATPVVKRRQVSRLVGAVDQALGGYAGGAALVAMINAGVVFTLAIMLGVGSAPMLAVWAFVWNFVPQIGGFMGGLPLVLFALVAGPGAALIATSLFLAYQLLENHVIQPAVIGAAIDVPPWGTLLAAMAGGAAAGVIGAILLTPMVGVVRVVRAELRRDDFPGAVAAVTNESHTDHSRNPAPAGA